MHSITTEIACLENSSQFATKDEHMGSLSSEELEETWERLCTGYVATGATLGVMAVVLVLFLFMLCLPWSKCRRLHRCLSGREQTNIIPDHRPNPLDQEAFDYYFPLSILDLFPPSMLPKLPNYDECIRDGVFNSPDDAPPPATPPPTVTVGDRLLSGAPVEHHTVNSSAGLDSVTPPPSYSSAQSPLDSGEPVTPGSATTAMAVTQDSQLLSSFESAVQVPVESTE